MKRPNRASPALIRRIEHIVLVSSSPRRKRLLEQLGIEFSIVEPEVDETVRNSVSPDRYVRIVARRKLEAYLSTYDTRWAIAADTVVALGGRVIGKPVDSADAERILHLLSGRAHHVVTALALYNPHSQQIGVKTVTTQVVFAALSGEEIRWYLDSQEWKGVAGGYRIQERGSVLVRKIVGSYSNVMGLPIQAFYGMVQAQGYQLFPIGE